LNSIDLTNTCIPIGNYRQITLGHRLYV